MRKIVKLSLAVLASSLLLAGCQNNDVPSSDSATSESADTYYLVSFYVDNVLYKTARVKAGEKVDVTIDDPTQDGCNFVGWTTSDGKVFDLANDVVNAKTDLYAKFEKVQTSVPDTSDPYLDETQLNVDDAQDASKSYYLVVGWWSNDKSGITDEIAKHFYANVNRFLRFKGAQNSDLANVSFRKFDQAKVADMGAAMNAQGDLDIVIGVGNNINSTGAVSIKEKQGGFTYGTITGRYAARLTDNEVAVALYNFLITDNGKKMADPSYTLVEGDIPTTPSTPDTSEPSTSEPSSSEPSTPESSESSSAESSEPESSESASSEESKPTPGPGVFTPESELSVNDTKEDGKTYYLVVGWWAYTDTSGLDDTLMKHFVWNMNVYLDSIGASTEDLGNISIRKFEQSAVADMGEAMNAQGDLDIIIGVGANITTKGKVTTVDRVDKVAMGGQSRTIARLTDHPVATTLFDFMKTDMGKTMYDTTVTFSPSTFQE